MMHPLMACDQKWCKNCVTQAAAALPTEGSKGGCSTWKLSSPSMTAHTVGQLVAALLEG